MRCEGFAAPYCGAASDCDVTCQYEEGIGTMELLWFAGGAGPAERAMSCATEASHPRIAAPVARLASCRPLAVRAFVGLTLCFSMAMLERAGAAEPAANVDANRIAAPDPANWPSYGRTYSEQRFSPLSRMIVLQKYFDHPSAKH